MCGVVRYTIPTRPPGVAKSSKLCVKSKRRGRGLPNEDTVEVESLVRSEGATTEGVGISGGLLGKTEIKVTTKTAVIRPTAATLPPLHTEN